MNMDNTSTVSSGSLHLIKGTPSKLKVTTSEAYITLEFLLMVRMQPENVPRGTISSLGITQVFSSYNYSVRKPLIFTLMLFQTCLFD